MKYIILLILALTTTYSYSQVERLITYGTAQQESGSNILSLPDGTIIIGARSSNNKFELLHLSENGTVINQIQLENTRSITQVILLKDNNLLILGSEGSSENNAIVIIKLDLLFNIIWSKSLQSTHMVYSYSARELTNGDIAITGYSSITGDSNPDWDCLIFRISSGGNLKWKKIIQTSLSSDWLLDFVELPGGNLVFAGASTSGSVDFLLIKTDANGNTIKSSTFGGSANEVIYSLLYINNKIVMNAGSWSFGLGEYDLVLSQCDTNFNIEYTKVYGGSKFDFPFCASFDDNEINISGYSRSFSSDANNDIVLFSFSPTGTLIRKKKIGGLGTEYSYTKGQLFTKINNSYFAFTGETSSHGKGMGDIFYAKINSSSNCCDFFSDISVQEISINLSTSNKNIESENIALNTFNNFTTSITNPSKYTPETNCSITSPNVSIVPNNTVFCVNSPLSFQTNTSEPGLTFAWDFGDPASGANNTSNSTEPSHLFSNTGNYIISVIATNGCASDTDTMTINLQQSIQLETQISSNQTTVCTKDTLKFNSISNDPNANYFWNFDDLASGADNTSNQAQTQHLFKNTGTYRVLLITNNPCHVDSDIITINVVGNEIADFNYSLDSCLGIIKLFTSLSSTNAFDWYLDDVFVNSQTSPSVNLENQGAYTFTLVLNPGSGCSDTVTKTIQYSNVLSSTGLLIPTVFTPNNDGNNDLYEVTGNTNCQLSSMIIFNRWGRKIYESDSDFRWNGKNGSIDSPVGTYILYLKYNDKEITKTFNLLR